MIGSDEMSSTSIDITESFRPEDLSKTDFFDFVTAPDLDIGVSVDRPQLNDTTNGTDQPLQGFDQFWGAEKDTSRLESAIFEDLSRYCWSQQNNGSSSSNQSANNTDGQIYTLTVLNGTEPWLRIDNNPDQSTTPALDFDSMLGNSFPGYIKTEYTYDDSGFGTDNNKDDLIQSQQQQQQQQSAITVTNNSLNSTNLISFQSNNNNDWQMVDHNSSSVEQETSESLLRSALQGKGYAKGLHLQNGITIIPTKNDDELRRVLFSTDQDTVTYADSTLSAPLYDENHIVDSPNSLPANTTGVVVDDMFLTLETAFTDDFEKIKRIASDVQQFCITTDSYSDVITEVAIQSAPEVTTTSISPPTKPTKKYKKSTNINNNSSNNNNNNLNNNNNNNINNNNNTNNNNSNNTNNNINISNNNNSINNNNNSPTHCNGQRKERSLHYCSICSKGFKDKYSVNVHIRTHTGEKPFACSLCGKSFRQKAHLAKHYQTHLAQKNAGVVTKIIKQTNSSSTTKHLQPILPLPPIQHVQLSPLPRISSISSNGKIVVTNR